MIHKPTDYLDIKEYLPKKSISTQSTFYRKNIGYSTLINTKKKSNVALGDSKAKSQLFSLLPTYILLILLVFIQVKGITDTCSIHTKGQHHYSYT